MEKSSWNKSWQSDEISLEHDDRDNDVSKVFYELRKLKTNRSQCPIVTTQIVWEKVPYHDSFIGK